ALASRRGSYDTGIVDEDVEPARLRSDDSERVVDGRVLAHVELDRQRRLAERLGRRARALQVQVADHDRCVPRSQFARDCQADAGRSAGHQGGLTCEISTHLLLVRGMELSMTPSIHALDHVAILVADTDAALAYYRDRLGLPVLTQELNETAH